MIAIGCLAPLILLVAGGLVGHWLAGTAGFLWGMAIGLGAGSVLVGTAGWIVAHLRS